MIYIYCRSSVPAALHTQPRCLDTVRWSQWEFALTATCSMWRLSTATELVSDHTIHSHTHTQRDISTLQVLLRFDTSARTDMHIIIPKKIKIVNMWTLNAITSKRKKKPWPGNKARRTQMDGCEGLKHIKEVPHCYGSQSIYLGLCFWIMSLITNLL